ncbi:DUF2235 domain-containing protein [Flavobacterium sp. LM4]|uniref:T6SS phospholipase effector Tle1-like catalytic domain-containing protein n=1 Tax=Flavobacterium sp. LM4 TaxID=1938609 RepID=UPI000993768D|nr:DUF2235 domain-containing protein [Flavobacterium sp. LM4]OOV19195.1 hypothetical protein BXU10_05865 [Flavobacterium sp. LM4]
MKERNVSGKTQITSDGKITFYSNGSIITNAKKIKTVGEQDGVKLDVKPEKLKLETFDKDDHVNVYIGMFFDGTGNNMGNSDSMYYTKLQDGMIKSKDIPQESKHKVTVLENGNTVTKTIDITDRDSYWNPYSNVAKLFQLYQQKSMDFDDKLGGNYLILKQYVEGIGTKEGEPDDIMGSGLARGSWGILGRVEEGIKKVVEEQIKNSVKGKKVNKIVFDVFGFSRGAAAARHFCNEVKEKAQIQAKRIKDPYDSKGVILSPTETEVVKHAGGYLGSMLAKNNIKPAAETYTIEIRFLGVFDTVVSDMVVKDNLGYKASVIFGLLPAIFQLSLDKVKTNISGLGIQSAFHIVANDEWRENFATTPMETGYTIKLIGAHSDIGGGYAELDKYEPVIDYFDLAVNDKTTMLEKEKIRQFYINNYFCKEEEIKFINTYDHYEKTVFLGKMYGVFPIYGKMEVRTVPDFYHNNKAPQIYDPKIGPLIMDKESDHFVIKDSRYISNKYSLVPMNMMLEKAIENKVPFCKDVNEAKSKGLKVSEPEEYDFSSEKILVEYLDLMKKVIKEQKGGTYQFPGNNMFATLRNKYVHLSAHYGGLKNDFIDIATGDHHILSSVAFVNQPVKYKIEGDTANYKREIYANK